MSVSAIQQLKHAETEAANLLQTAEQKIQKQRDEIPEVINQFKEELLQQEEIQQQEILQQIEVTFQTMNDAIIQQKQSQINQLHNISPERREKALNLIREKVVS